MALTKAYKTTVLNRIQRDPDFARKLRARAVRDLLSGQPADGLSTLRDLVHAGPGIVELARRTGLGQKSLLRMLKPTGNPTLKSLNQILKHI